MARAAGQVDSETFIVPMGFKIFKFDVSFSAQWNRAIIGLGLAHHLMRILDRVLKLFFAGKTSELHLIHAVDDEPVYFLTRSKICEAVRTRVIFFGPVIDAFVAVQLVAFTAINHLR